MANDYLQLRQRPIIEELRRIRARSRVQDTDATQAVGKFLCREALSGAIDGVNRVFKSSKTPVGARSLWWRGLLRDEGIGAHQFQYLGGRLWQLGEAPVGAGDQFPGSPGDPLPRVLYICDPNEGSEFSVAELGSQRGTTFKARKQYVKQRMRGLKGVSY